MIKDATNRTTPSLSPAIAVQKKHFDDFDDLYPYARELKNEEQFQSLSFFDGDIGNFVRDSNTENFRFDKDDRRQFNITVDIAYEIQRQGHYEITNKVVSRVPIFRKVYYKNTPDMPERDRIDPRTCRLHYHGFYLSESDECIYYM